MVIIYFIRNKIYIQNHVLRFFLIFKKNLLKVITLHCTYMPITNCQKVKTRVTVNEKYKKKTTSAIKLIRSKRPVKVTLSAINARPSTSQHPTRNLIKKFTENEPQTRRNLPNCAPQQRQLLIPLNIIFASFIVYFEINRPR